MAELRPSRWDQTYEQNSGRGLSTESERHGGKAVPQHTLSTSARALSGETSGALLLCDDGVGSDCSVNVRQDVPSQPQQITQHGLICVCHSPACECDVIVTCCCSTTCKRSSHTRLLVSDLPDDQLICTVSVGPDL